jgi:hypothetical protein
MASQMVASLMGEMMFLPALLCAVGVGRKRKTESAPSNSAMKGPHFAIPGTAAGRKHSHAARRSAS